MYNAIRIDVLEDMSRHAKNPPYNHRVEMGSWFFTRRRNPHSKSCGTAGCLVGTYAYATGMRLELLESGRSPEERMAIYAKIPYKVSEFLFSCHLSFHMGWVRPAADLPAEAAIARLDKTIAYFKRKRALWEDHEWWMSLPKRLRLEHVSPQKAKEALLS